MFDRWKDRLAKRRQQNQDQQPQSTNHEQGEATMDQKQDMNETNGTNESAAVVDASSTGISPAMQIRGRIIAVLKTVYDPEIPVDIYELGLIYGVEVTDDGEAHVTMTLTTPMCPVAETLPPEVEDKVRNVMGVKDCSLDLVWDPPWSVDMMSDAARLELNMM
jgi:FeS assembly SUF system protein